MVDRFAKQFRRVLAVTSQIRNLGPLTDEWGSFAVTQWRRIYLRQSGGIIALES
jgi:hypothetical protein